MVKIQLTDINDNRPIFYPREYNVSLRESLPTSASVVAVVASDPDSGRFGTVTYRIVAGNDAGIFRIDRVTGEIFVTRPNLLSSRNQPYHSLNISAIDGGGLRTAQDAEVFISIIDSSQRPPIFDKTRYNFSIKEDAKKNTIAGSVSATSSNSGELQLPNDSKNKATLVLSDINDRCANQESERDSLTIIYEIYSDLQK